MSEPVPVLSIRAFRASDRRALEELWARVFPDDPPMNAPAAMIDRKLQIQPELLLIGNVEAELVAAIIAGFDGVRGWIYHLAVAPEWRRHGFASELVRAAEDRLLALGCTKVNLQIRTANHAVSAFYERLGYSVEERVSMGRRLSAASNTPRTGGHRLTSHTIDTEAGLRQLLGQPAPLVVSKVVDRLNPFTRRFIEASPFVCLATSDRAGNCDVSPRGDPRGFVRIIDDRTLLLPERPGNRLADSLTNVLQTGRVGLLFIIPGVSDTFRVNGRATITTDQELLAPSTVEGKVPRLGLLIDIEAAFTHCSKAFLRAGFWDAKSFVERSQLPSNGEIFQALDGSFDAEQYDRERAERYARRVGFY